MVANASASNRAANAEVTYEALPCSGATSATSNPISPFSQVGRTASIASLAVSPLGSMLFVASAKAGSIPSISTLT
jgi:hypothetical protein